MELKTEFSKGQIRELTQVIRGGAYVHLLADKSSQVSLMSEALSVRFGTDECLRVILSCDSVMAAINQIKVVTLSHEGSIPERMNNTIPSGDGLPRGERMKDVETVEVKKTKTPKAEKAPKEPKAPRVPKERAPAPGRGALDGKLITAVGPNWRREGTHGHKTVEVMLANPGAPLTKLIELGARRKDIMWDMEFNPGKIVLEDDPNAAASAEAKKAD